jgi:hypothetical protein
LRGDIRFDTEGFWGWLNCCFGSSFIAKDREHKVNIITKSKGLLVCKLVDISQKMWECQEGQNYTIMSRLTQFTPLTNKKGATIMDYVANAWRVIKENSIVLVSASNAGFGRMVSNLAKQCCNRSSDVFLWRETFFIDKSRDNSQCDVKVKIGDDVEDIPVDFRGGPFDKSGCPEGLDVIYPSEISFGKNSKVIVFYDYQFAGCKSLKKINIPDKVRKLNLGMFSSCALVEIIFGEASELEILANDVFAGCASLEEIVVPPQVKEICEGAFRACVKLASITFLGESVPAISLGAFGGCVSLKNIAIRCYDLSSFVGKGFSNVVLPSVKKLEVTLEIFPGEQSITPWKDAVPTFLRKYCCAIVDRNVIFNSKDGSTMAFECNIGKQWTKVSAFCKSFDAFFVPRLLDETGRSIEEEEEDDYYEGYNYALAMIFG